MSQQSRRKFVIDTAKVSAAVIAAPFVHTARAAGSLSVGLWDHWVPGANKATTDLINEWAAKEKVDVKIDYITSQGNKLLLTTAAEAQAKSGHDILALSTWLPADHAKLLEPVDDIMADLIKEHGAVNGTVEYLGKVDGKWMAIPATVGAQIKGPCSRIDLLKQHAGIDIKAMYPAGSAPKADAWTTDTFLKAAEACHKGGVPFGIGFGTTSDSVDSCGSFFHAFGANLVDAKGNIVVKSDETKQVLEYLKRLIAFLPADVPAWDDASNNKWLVSGKGAMIMNPPSAWLVARRDNMKIAEQCWTFPAPKGPKGRYLPGLPFFWGIWKWSKNVPAAKSLLAHLSERSSIERLVTASSGYDMPGFSGLRDFKAWAEEGPPKGSVYNYPPRADQIVSIAGSPAPVRIANQIYNQATMTKMIAKCTQGGESIDKAIGWAASELEGFMRV